MTILLVFTAGEGWAQTAVERWETGTLDSALVSGESAQDLVAKALGLLESGELEQPLKLLNRAETLGPDQDTRDWIVWGKARIARDRGDVETAERLLREVLSARPQAHAIRLELGKVLLSKGAKSEAELVLDSFSSFFNNRLLKTSAELQIVSEAMALLGSFQDANHAAQLAYDDDPKNVRNLVSWGNLLLSKYNYRDADKNFREALDVQSEHPGALVGLAKVELEDSNSFNEARNLLDRAAMTSPLYPDVWTVNARISIFDSDCKEAMNHLDKVFKQRPNHLEARALELVCSYLGDNEKEFERQLESILETNPRYVDVFSTLSEFAVRAYRYDDAVRFDRRALQIEPGHSASLIGLGIGLSRTGKEDEALGVFRDAFDADPYNVRAFNMVELYEKKIPEYEFTEYPRFKIRAHQAQREAINHLVSPLVAQALDEFDTKYKFKPDPYLAVEVFPDAEVFSVRSVGVPNISPQGVCFGKVTVVRSPSDGNFNWAQVVWHELAHVYHIQISNSRVPRWFTEGMAEYETNVKDPAWSRHHDKELARGLVAGELKGVMDLDKGFTHARTLEEVLRAYHQASLVIHYLAQTHGYPKLVEMLRAWGAKKSNRSVYNDVLGVSPEDIDAGFRTWLLKRFMNFQNQLLVDLAKVGGAAEIRSELLKDSDNLRLRADLAVALYRDGNTTEALKELEAVLAASNPPSEARMVAALIYASEGRLKDAHEQGSLILGAAQDSYDLRMLMGSAAQGLEKVEEAEIHFHAATELFENGQDAWDALDKFALMRRDDQLAERALTRLFALDPHDTTIARRYGELMLERGDLESAKRAGERWMEIAPFDARAHQFIAEVALKSKDVAGAEKIWETALIVRNGEEREIILGAIKLAQEHKMADLEARWTNRAKELGLSDRQIQRALEIR